MKYILTLVLLVQILACGNNKEQLINVDEVSPWCILGFDSENRSPQERIDLLQELGLDRYGFNRGKGDFGAMVEEFGLAKENDIDIT